MRRLGVARQVKSRAECITLKPVLANSIVGIVSGLHTPQDESGDASADAGAGGRRAEVGFNFQ